MTFNSRLAKLAENEAATLTLKDLIRAKELIGEAPKEKYIAFGSGDLRDAVLDKTNVANELTFNGVFGLTVLTDHSLPENVIQLRDGEGNVLRWFVQGSDGTFYSWEHEDVWKLAKERLLSEGGEE